MNTGIADRIKNARESLGFDQKSFAESIGVSSGSTISRWERGLNFPPADTLAVIQEKYGISVEWIVTGRGSMKGETTRTPRVKPPLLDTDVLNQVIVGVEQALAEMGRVLKPEKKAELIILLYEHFVTKDEVEEETIERWLKVVA